jgi:carboxylesterase type B
MYRWDHVASFAHIFSNFGLPKVCDTRVCHATEIPFVYHNSLNYTLLPNETVLSDAMIKYWTNFAKTGSPNSPNSGDVAVISKEEVLWPKYGVPNPHPGPLQNNTRVNMRLAIPISIESSDHFQKGGYDTPGVCAMFDLIGYDH